MKYKKTDTYLLLLECVVSVSSAWKMSSLLSFYFDCFHLLLRSCVKVLGYPSPYSPCGFCGRKATLNLSSWTKLVLRNSVPLMGLLFKTAEAFVTARPLRACIVTVGVWLGYLQRSVMLSASACHLLRCACVFPSLQIHYYVTCLVYEV